MSGLTVEERKRLEQVVARRVGTRSDAAELVSCYLVAMERNAFFRTTDDGPVPTSLTAERSLLLIEISRQLGRVIEDFEIQALLRVTLPAARAMRNTLLATYSDDADLLMLAWSLRGARTGGRVKTDTFTGTEVTFASEDRRDAFVDQLERAGTTVETMLGDPKKPWRVVVGDDFPKSQLPAK